MPFNGSGVYTAPAADFPVVTQTVISSTHFNNTINDIATALSTCLTKDGQQTATANIPFGGFRATNVGITAIAGSVGTPAINVSDTGTGLYRSAASELAVTVAGTQRARFDGTGLIVTGVGTFSGATSTTTLTASTSVVTPLVGTATDIRFDLQIGGASRWVIFPSGSNYDLYPSNADNTQSIGSTANRVKQVFTPIIDSGTTGSLSLKLNNGEIGFQVVRNGIAVNNFTVEGSAAGGSLAQRAVGTDTDISVLHTAKGAGIFQFNTGGGAQFQILHTASATRNITVTGSNGGNPTISTTAGSLAITPAVVMASGLSTVGAILASGGILLGAARLQAQQGTDVNSANNMTVGTDGNFFALTSSTQMNLLNNTGWQGGSVVTLYARAVTPTIKHNQAASGNFRPIILNGAVDFVMAANNTLTLVLEATNNFWVEVSRKV